MMAPVIDLSGQRFGRLTVWGKSDPRPDAETRWHCRCDCGAEKVIRSKDLRRGLVLSCGCLKREITAERNLTHGMSGRPEYLTWARMLQRCYNPKASHFDWYGGRGIKVCERWRSSFEAFFRDVGCRPHQKYSLERIDNNGDYEPGNVRWASHIEQMQNTRRSRLICFRGQTMTVAAAVRAGGNKVVPQLAISRLNRGWPVHEAVTMPVGRARP